MNLIVFLDISQRDSILRIISFTSNGASYKNPNTEEISRGLKDSLLVKLRKDTLS